MKTESVEYRDGEVALKGYLAYDDQTTQKMPGILVMPEAFGLGVNAKNRAERLAALGYVALAGDPHGDGFETSDIQEAIKLSASLMSDPAKFRARGRAGLDKLASLPPVDSSRLAVVGYCIGGTFALELARDGAPVKGVVSFHGGLSTQAPIEAGKTQGKVPACHGADDPFVPPDQVHAFVEEMTKAGVDWQLISYGGTVHSFTNPNAASVGNPGIAYNKSADERSWQAMRDFFNEIFAA
jgi:dienelactone hydrolase